MYLVVPVINLPRASDQYLLFAPKHRWIILNFIIDFILILPPQKGPRWSLWSDVFLLGLCLIMSCLTVLSLLPHFLLKNLPYPRTKIIWQKWYWNYIHNKLTFVLQQFKFQSLLQLNFSLMIYVYLWYPLLNKLNNISLSKSTKSDISLTYQKQSTINT